MARPLTALATLLATFMALAPAPVAPQAIAGVVVDDRSLEPVPGALVRLVIQGWLDRATETDSLGRFFLATPREDQYQLEVSRMGYQTTRSQRVLVAEGDTVSVEFRVLPDAVLLDPITVTGYTRRGRDAFDRRRQEWGRGLFLTPAQIDSIAPQHPAHALEGLEKVHVEWGWGPTPSGGSGPMPSVRGLLGRGCLLYMVDFVPVRPEPFAPGIWSGYQLGSLLGKDIVAVEGLPLRFRGPSGALPFLQPGAHHLLRRWTGRAVPVLLQLRLGSLLDPSRVVGKHPPSLRNL